MHFGFGFIRPGVTLVAFAVGYAILRPSTMSTRFLGTWVGWLVPAMGIIALASLPFGLSPGGSAAYFIDNFSKVLVTSMALLMTTRGVYDSAAWMIGYVAGCAMLAWYALFVFDLSSVGSLTARLNDLYTYDANDVGLLLVVGLPLCMWLFDSSRGVVKIFAGVVMGASVWAIALTGSRGAFLALIVVGLGLLVVALERVSIAKRIVAVGAVAVLLVLAAPPGYWNQMSTVFSVEEDYNWTSDTGRKAVATRGIAYMLEYPLFGVGIDNFPRAEGTISSMARDAMPGGPISWTAPHNSYIQVAAELGIPGALVFVALVFGGMGGMFLVSRRASRRWGRRAVGTRREVVMASQYIALSFAGFTIGASFLSFAYLDLIYLLTAMSVGVYLEERRLRAEDDTLVPAGGTARSSGVGMRGALALAEAGDATVAGPPRRNALTLDR
jgi:hypothetical protein